MAVSAQTIAVLAPDRSPLSSEAAGTLIDQLAGKFKVLDESLAMSAFASAAPSMPFNMTLDDAKRVGSTISCDFFVLVRAANQRRSAYKRMEYYEAYAIAYLVSARSGRLILWKLYSTEAENERKAAMAFDGFSAAMVSDIGGALKSASVREMSDVAPASYPEVPEAGTPESKGFRPPIPYKRVKPEYTTKAASYDVTATVDMVMDLNVDGTIERTEITRWAGFGLEESVETAVRAMNWRPAERGGKFIPSRFLLRYNFKKIDKDAEVK